MEQFIQVEMVKELAEKLKRSTPNKAEILATFISAGILDKNCNFTRHYTSLKSSKVEANHVSH